MSFSFSIKSKPQSNRLRKPSSAGKTDSSTVYVTEFRADEAPPPLESKIEPIEPIADSWCPNKKVKKFSQSNGADSAPEFELDSGSNAEACDGSMVYGLNLRQPSALASVIDVPARDHGETILDLQMRKWREDMEKLPEAPGVDEFEDAPVEGFGARLLAGYEWKEGRGIGRNAKEDVKIFEVTKRIGREGIGFTGELHVTIDGNAGEGRGNRNVRREKMENREDNEGFGVGEEVRVVNKRKMGMKGKIVEVKDGGDIVVLRMSRRNENVRIQIWDVVEVGSSDDEKCVRNLKELKDKEKDVKRDKKGRNISRKRGRHNENAKAWRERVDWLRNHIRVRIISEEFKGGRLFLKKGVVVDVIGPGVCDILIDESGELVQGVDQKFLQTALPKRGGSVLVLYGRHKGAYGSLLERDVEKGMVVVRDGETHELLNVKVNKIAEYTGDPSDIGY